MAHPHNGGDKQIADHIESSMEIVDNSTRDDEKAPIDANNNERVPMRATMVLALVAQAFLFSGSQIPLYFFGAIPPIIYSDIGGVDIWIWFVLAYLLSLATICPFVGSISDLIGRRWVALGGSGLLVLSMIICGVAKSMGVFIFGMTLCGIGAGVCELTSIAVASELVPTRLRGKFVAFLMLSLVPFAPSALYAQLISTQNWRYCALFCGLWCALGFLGTLLFYTPLPRPATENLTKKEIVGQIDIVGGLLSVTGIITFLVGLQCGGYPYPWTSPRVLAPLIIGGILLFIAFPIWEIKFAKYPMFPSRMKQETRVLSLTLIITSISGANFFSLIMFWPTQAFNVYGHDPVGVGLRVLPIGCGIIGGAIITLWLLSFLRGHIRELLVGSCVMMTAGCGALAYAEQDNSNKLWGILLLGSLGIGGIVVPASVITTIICPDDIIATVTSLTLSIRVIGGCIGYTIYFNLFVNRFIPSAVKHIGSTMVEMGITNGTDITHAIEFTAASLLEPLRTIPGIGQNDTVYEAVVLAGQLAYAESYKIIYLSSIAFGGVAIVASLFVGNINKYMDDHVAVRMG